MPRPTAQPDARGAAELRRELEFQHAQLRRMHGESATVLRRALELEYALTTKAAKVSQQTAEIERLKLERDMAIAPAADAESIDPRSDPKTALDQQLLENSYLFDPQWYLERYPDVARANIDALRHYLEIGAKEGRNPSSFFNTRWYLHHYPEAAEAGCNPLVHYLRWGQAEGWRTRPGD